MKLNWTYDPNTREAKTVITDSLYYTTNNGGQTINKFVDGILDRSFHKYGEGNTFTETSHTGRHAEFLDDDWPNEVAWLSKTYPEIVGKLYQDWDNGFKNRKGQIEDIGSKRGFGITDPDELISINRMCAPANFIEWWGWELIAFSEEKLDEDSPKGVVWMKNNDTGEIVRVSAAHPPMPCCVFPKIHGPWPVTEDDIKEHGGVMLPNGFAKLL